MTQNNLQRILNSIYELEGLVTLALNGKQDMVRLYNLMVEKADSISSNMKALKPVEAASPTVAPIDMTYAMPCDEDIESVQTAKEVAVTPPPVTPRIPSVSQSEMAAPATVQPKPAPPVPPKSELKAPVISAFADSERPASVEPRKPLFTSVKEVSRQGVTLPNSKQKISGETKKLLRKMFPINEWFLFRRELFAGSDADFNASLSLVEELGSYEKAEAYFYTDLQWNPEEKNVKDFMKVVQNYFN